MSSIELDVYDQILTSLQLPHSNFPGKKTLQVPFSLPSVLKLRIQKMTKVLWITEDIGSVKVGLRPTWPSPQPNSSSTPQCKILRSPTPTTYWLILDAEDNQNPLDYEGWPRPPRSVSLVWRPKWPSKYL